MIFFITHNQSIIKRIILFILLFSAAITVFVPAALLQNFYFPFYVLIILDIFLFLSAAFLYFVFKPVYVLYCAIFILLLPIGFIPPNIHSYINRSLAVFSFLVWLLDTISNNKIVRFSYCTLFMLCFLAWSAITLLWAKRFDMGFIILQAYTLRFLLFIVLVPNLINTKESIDGLMKVLALNAVLMMFFVLYNLLLGGFTPLNRNSLFSENENSVGLLFLISSIGIIWLTIKPSQRFRRTATIISIFIILTAIILIAMSGSRGSAISLLVLLTFFLIWKTTRIWGMSGIVILILLSISTPTLFQTTLQRFIKPTSETLLGGREKLWRGGLELIGTAPICGIGIGNASFEIQSILNIRGDYIQGASIHNPIITVWAETGIIGIAFYLATLLISIFLFVKNFKKYINVHAKWIHNYFALVSSILLAYLASWIKGGGAEKDYIYFFIISLLLIPSYLKIDNIKNNRDREKPYNLRPLTPPDLRVRTGRFT